MSLMTLPWPERLKKLRDPAVRAAILADDDPNDDALRNIMRGCFDATYPLGQPLDYEPDPKDSIGARAKRALRPKKRAILRALSGLAFSPAARRRAHATVSGWMPSPESPCSCSARPRRRALRTPAGGAKLMPS